MNRSCRILFVFLFCLLFASCSNDDDEGNEIPVAERTTGDTYKELSSPVLPAITIDLSKASYQVATPVYSTDINN